MLVSAVWIAPAVLATISRVAERRLNGEPPASAQDLLWAGGDWLVYAVLTPPIFAVSRRWPIARPHVARRALLHLGFALIFCVAWASLGKMLQILLAFLFRRGELQALIRSAGGQFWEKLGRDLLGWIFTTLPFGVVVYLSIAGIAHAIRYFFEATDREIQLARVSEQLAGARLAALQAQLNPHFLFNSLNTIAVLVRDGDRRKATQVIEQLSDVLRSTLGRTRATEVTLDDELTLVRQYLAVEQARFSDRLRPTLDIDPATRSAAVPRFALQHLVENALRHGIAKRTDRPGGRDGAAGGDILELSVERQAGTGGEGARREGTAGQHPRAPAPALRRSRLTRRHRRGTAGHDRAPAYPVSRARH
jgi:hypothetical protein